MKKNVFPLLYFMLLLAVGAFFTACESAEQTALKKVNNAFRESLSKMKFSLEKGVPIYIVIPRTGCGGCISDAEVFVKTLLQKKDKDADKIRIILTDYQSEKLLRIRFGSLIGDKRIMLDKYGVFNANPSLHAVYPVIYFLDQEGNVERTGSFSVDESGWGIIKNYLANKE